MLADLATDLEIETAIADLSDDVVHGDRASGSAFLATGSGSVELVSLPGVVTVSASCFAAGPNHGMNVEVVNEAPVADWDYVVRQESEAPGASLITSDELGAGDSVNLAFDPDDNTQTARYLQLMVYAGTPLTIEVGGITSNPRRQLPGSRVSDARRGPGLTDPGVRSGRPERPALLMPGQLRERSGSRVRSHSRPAIGSTAGTKP